MGAPHLTVVDAQGPDVCGAQTRGGDPCQNPPTSGGRCWIESHRQDVAETSEEAPDPPDHLGEIGRHYWRYHVSRCEKVGVLDLVDLTVLEKAAEVAEIIRRCWEHVKEHGPTVPDKNNSTKTNPALSKYNSLMPDYRQLTKQIDGWVTQGEREKSESVREDDPWGEGW